MTLRPPLVSVFKLSKHYVMEHGRVQALQEVSLDIHSGDSVAIMGPSGSGKSTLLHLLGCLDTPTTGDYWLDGRNIARLLDYDLALIRSKHIGFVFQSFNLIPQLTVYENVEVAFLYQSHLISPEEIHKCIIESLKRVGLDKRLYHLPSQLSGGETQRAAIARALAVKPLIILADEPTGNLDTETGETILQLFQELNTQGVTLVIVTHDKHVSRYCKRLVKMRDGQIISNELHGG